MKDWSVFVNPAAGRRPEEVARVEAALAAHSVDARVLVPAGTSALREEVTAAADAGVRRFAVVGGDGSLHVLVGALLDREWQEPPVVGILPSGTGCDFARTFGLPQTVEEAAAHLVGERTYPADVGVLEGDFGRRRFVNVAQAGVGGAAAETAARMSRRWGSAKYLVAFGVRLPRFRPAQVRLVAGRRSYEGPALAVIFANAQFFAGGWNVAPKATLVDGLLDLQVIAARKREAPRLVPKIMRGLHLTDRSVRRFSSPEFSLETDGPWPVEADGEYLGHTPVRGWVERAAIHVKI